MTRLADAKRYITTIYRPTHRPWLLEFRSSTSFITATVCTAIFTDIFLYAVIVPVFPFSLVQRVGVAEKDVQHWLSVLLSVYGAALLVAAPIFGWISDRINSRRGMLLWGMLVLGAATVILCLAKNLPLLIVGRLLQGASAGVVWVVGLALLSDTVGKERAGQSMGYVAMAYSVAALVAPLLGGVVYDKAGYYSVFAMAFGMIVLDIFLRLILIEKKVAKRWLTETEPSISLPPLAPAMAQPSGPAGEQEVDPKHRTATNPSVEQEDSTTPIKKALPPILILLKSRRMQATFWASTIDAMILTGFDVTLPLFVQNTFHWNSIGAGLIFLASLSPTFFQPIYGRCVDTFGPRWIAGAGLLICVPPFVCFRFVTHDSLGQKILFCALLAIIGLGASLTLAATMAEFRMICEEKERKKPGSMGKSGAYAQSYGLFNVSWALGSLIGSYWAGGIKQAAGFGAMGWSFALLCGVFVVPTTLYIGGSIFERKRNAAAETAPEV